MSTTIPPIERRLNHYGRERWLLSDQDSFTYDHWVPAIVDIKTARNYDEQKRTIARGIIGLVASHSGLLVRSQGRAEALHFARLRVTEGTPQLSSLALRNIRVGYQTPDEDTPNPAFAVIDSGSSYHHVVRDPDEQLDEIGTSISNLTAEVLVEHMYYQYPGFGIYERLAKEGMHFED